MAPVAGALPAGASVPSGSPMGVGGREVDRIQREDQETCEDQV